ncbi:MAG TPA: CehA/McbA family metallohydrolase [Polyangiaceae bacterium LLY-WYZ-15_(1-7)]|nr:CehA/McbA family metallohydrolase [Polyangiaceae bacterium LLY-WYZ-15_(1-7)]HJL00600.1 CehA/McbA family metallohydrolase [Polyangiaceae bacterium LLY-WYZ-15_(1-7)]HJL13200.1 CehA/McbA family metallohydrolase [Polyangiaceae bacterium LLY-WYZ-15_(1-7)]
MKRLLFLVALLSAACTGGTSNPLGGTDGGPGEDAGEDAAAPTCDGVDPFDTGEATGAADPLGAGADEARAGLLAAEDLPPDPDALRTWAPGDFVLANDRVALVIEATGPSDGYDPWGGKPVGLARVEDGALVEPADFNELIPGVGRYTFEATSVGVLADGSDGGEAIVRAVGALRAIPFINDLASALAPGDYDDMEVAVDYVLAPNAEHVDVRYTVASPRAGTTRAQQLVLIFQTSRMPAFIEGEGFAFSEGVDLSWIGFADDDATSYVLETDEGFTYTLGISGAQLMSGARFPIPGCAATEVPGYRLHIGGTGMGGARAAQWRHQGVSLEERTGVLREDGGDPAAGAWVFAEDEGGALLARTLTDEEGRYRFELPADAAPRFRAHRRGTGLGSPGEGPDLALPAHGFISVQAVDGEGAAMPARLQVLPADGMTGTPGRYGLAPLPGGRSHVEFPVDGAAVFRVAAGTHRVVASRGPGYDLFETDVEVAAGETVELTASLPRVVAPEGVLCADYHIHTHRSPDSPDPADFKLRTAAGDGLDIPCRSDHEWVVGWEDRIADLGLAGELYGVTSLELTTFAWGHMGVVPIRPLPDQPNGGAELWIDRLPPEVFASVRARPEAPLVIINHPRGPAIGGYFTAAGFDPVTGSVDNPEMWDEDFGLVEVFNDASFDESFEIVEDWFALLRQGRRVFAVGSSDSHRVLPGSPVGYPRTCLRLGVDDVEALRSGGGEDAVRDATGAGHFSVNGGIWVDATGRDGVRTGETLTGASGPETFRVTVDAAPWIDVDTLEVWVDGELSESIPIAASADVRRFEEDVVVEGGWVVFHAKGDESLAPVHPGAMPFGVTMPIFMEE